MCGRFSLSLSGDIVAKHFSLTSSFVLKPRYNIAPLQKVPVIREHGCLEFLTWGLRPAWLKDSYNSLINARIETINEKPAFKNAFKKQRCIIVADGYYEWKSIKNRKRPYHVTLRSGNVFALAGIWCGDSCAVITQVTLHNELSHLHARMPVILPKSGYLAWLDRKKKISCLQELLNFSKQENFLIKPVTTKVGDPSFDTKTCIESIV